MNADGVDKGSIEVSLGTINSIKYIITAPSKNLFSFTISEKILNELKLISNIYLNEKLEKNYKIEDIF